MGGNKIIGILTSIIIVCAISLILMHESIERKKENVFAEFQYIRYAESICNDVKNDVEDIISEIQIKMEEQRKESEIINNMIAISGNKISELEATEMLKIIRYYADKYKFDEFLILGMVAQESRFSNTAKSRADARGLMQITPIALNDFNNTNETFFTIEDLKDSTINIMIGCWILNRQKRYLNSDDLSDCIISYNSGATNFKNNKDDYKASYSYLDKVNYFKDVFLGNKTI